MGAIFSSRRALWLLGVAMLALLATPNYQHDQIANAAGACDVSDTSLDAEESAYLQMLNSYRQQNNLKPLKISNTLNRSASWMAVDLARGRYFSHTDSLGRSPTQRAQACGYNDQAGENLAAGTDWATATAAMSAWKNSPSHDSNMKTAFYTVVGIARYFDPNSQYGWYWVADFGMTDDTGTPAPPAPAPPAPAPAPPTPAPAPPSKPAAVINLSAGANLISWPGPTFSPSSMDDANGAVEVVYSFDQASGTWQRYGRSLPNYLNNLTVLESGQAYWVMANYSAKLTVAQ